MKHQNNLKTSFVIAFLSFALAFNACSQGGDTILFGRVLESRTKKPVPHAEITIYGTLETSIELKANAQGQYFVTRPPLKEGESYVITCGLKGKFLPKTGKFTFYPKFPDKALEFNFEMDRGCMIYLPDIFFEKDNFKLTPDNIILGDKMVEILNDNPTIIVEISGHADLNEKSPQKLSEQRANAVKKYLIKEGINKKRLVAVGYGDSNPIKPQPDDASNTNEIEATIRINGVARFKVLRSDYVPEE